MAVDSADAVGQLIVVERVQRGAGTSQLAARLQGATVSLGVVGVVVGSGEEGTLAAAGAIEVDAGEADVVASAEVLVRATLVPGIPARAMLVLLRRLRPPRLLLRLPRPRPQAEATLRGRTPSRSGRLSVVAEGSRASKTCGLLSRCRSRRMAICLRSRTDMRSGRRRRQRKRSRRTLPPKQIYSAGLKACLT